MRTTLTSLLAAILLLAAPACNQSPIEPEIGEADFTMLFVGNSLTYTNDLPGMVETIGAHLGLSVGTAMVAAPNYSLEDHWNSGISSTIAALGADVVIMQQGPSSLPQNQLYLLEWTERLAGSIEQAGSRPALMMVWPDVTRFHAFDDVRDSYRNAAEAVEGDFVPVGEVFRRLLAIPGGTDPLGSDGFHPSYYGSVAGAVTILRFYFPDAVTDLPGEIVAPAGRDLPGIFLTDEQMQRIVNVVEIVMEESEN